MQSPIWMSLGISLIRCRKIPTSQRE